MRFSRSCGLKDPFRALSIHFDRSVRVGSSDPPLSGEDRSTYIVVYHNSLWLSSEIDTGVVPRRPSALPVGVPCDNYSPR